MASTTINHLNVELAQQVQQDIDELNARFSEDIQRDIERKAAQCQLSPRKRSLLERLNAGC